MSSSSGDAAAVKSPHFPRRSLVESKGPKRDLRFWLSAWVPVAIGIGIIALESTVWGGADHTSGPLRAVWEFLFGPVSAVRWEHIHHYIRKSGHFGGYGFLCLAWLRAFRLSFPRFSFIKYAEFAVLGTGTIAAADEIHQHFLANRTSTPWDVLLDCCGATFMCIAVWAVLYVVRKQPPGQPKSIQ